MRNEAVVRTVPCEGNEFEAHLQFEQGRRHRQFELGRTLVVMSGAERSVGVREEDYEGIDSFTIPYLVDHLCADFGVHGDPEACRDNWRAIRAGDGRVVSEFHLPPCTVGPRVVRVETKRSENVTRLHVCRAPLDFGDVVFQRGLVARLREADVCMTDLLLDHQYGYWGAVCPARQALNEEVFTTGVGSVHGRRDVELDGTTRTLSLLTVIGEGASCTVVTLSESAGIVLVGS